MIDDHIADDIAVETLETWDPMRQHFEASMKTNESELIGDIIEPLDDDSIKRTEICEHWAKYGSCCDGDYCTKKHVNNYERRSMKSFIELHERRKVFTRLFSSDLEFKLEIIPDQSTLMLAIVTNPMKPSNFYIILPNDLVDFSNMTKEDCDFYIDRSCSSSAYKIQLRNCHNRLAELIGNIKLYDPNEEIFIDQLVACNYMDTFYRAIVIETPNIAFDRYDYRLCLIDVGTEIEVARENIRALKAPVLTNSRILAINCRLNIKPPNGCLDWPQESLDRFRELTLANQFFCKFIDYIAYDDIYVVDLYTLSRRKSLTNRLIQEQLAEALDA